MRRRAGWAAPALAFVLVFSGCAQAETDLTAESAAQFQSFVVSVAETAATGDYAAATAELDALQTALDTALAEGDVSDDRAASIQAAIDAVRADLLQAAESVTPSVPAEEPVEAPDVPEAPEPDEDNGGNRGNGNDGNGKGNGNGNGNGRNGVENNGGRGNG